jgi:hypothetical protein
VIGQAMFPYDPETMPLAPREVTVYRSDDEIQRWMDQRSTPKSRRTAQRRQESFRRAATTPSKVRALTEKQIAHYEALAEDADSSYWRTQNEIARKYAADDYGRFSADRVHGIMR